MSRFTVQQSARAVDSLDVDWKWGWSAPERAMFGQQLGRLDGDRSVEPPLALPTDVGQLRPLADSAALGEGRGRFATGLASIDSGALVRPGYALGLRHVETCSAPSPVEGGAGGPWWNSPLPSSRDASRPAAPFVDRMSPIRALITPCQPGASSARRCPADVAQRGVRPRAGSLQTMQGLGSRRPAAAIETMLRRLLADHRVLAARKLADAVPRDQVLDESLRRLLIVLAEPVVRRRRPARAKSSDNIEWLRRNAGGHAGWWVALADGELLAADESLAALGRKLTGLAPHARPFLHRL